MYSKEILNNLTNEEKLNALCRSRNIDLSEEEKEFLILEKDMNVAEISVEAMRW